MDDSYSDKDAPEVTPGRDDQDDSRSPDDILKEALSRFELAKESESETRKLALDDQKFRAGDQWPDNIKQDRERDGRPCLVINRLPQFVQQVTNDQRQNRPAIKVHPVGGGADVDTAKVIQGLIRHIEYNSNAEVAYDTAFEGAVSSGLGYFRITPDYLDSDSFDQEIYIKRIKDPLSVYYDPFVQEPDGSDANWAFVVDDLSKDEYKEKYPNSKLSDPSEDWESIGNSAPEWVRQDGCRVAEYFYKETKPGTIHLLKTGEIVRDDELQARQASAAQNGGLDASVVKSRSTKFTVVKWCKINAVEILEMTEFPVPFIPIIPVYGTELVVNGKRILESIIRHAKDPQRMLNYWKSAETEAIALAPRTPFIGAEGQFEGYESDWETANRRNHAYLQYKPTSIAGQQIPPPARQAFEPAVQAITQASMGAVEDLKATTGVYDAGVGNSGPEISGVALQKRASQIQTSAFHFVDNLTRSMRYAGRILVELIPKIYDTARAARIIADDGDQKIVMLNQPTKNESGKDVLYDLSVGCYDVTVDTGPSFASKRQEAAASMMDFSRSVPQVAQSCADLIVKNMDWPGAQEIADRLKLLLPPNLQVDPKQQQIPPQIQAQMQQMQQLMQKLDNENSELTKIVETQILQLQHKERVELAKISSSEKIALLKVDSVEAVELLKRDFAAIQHRLDLIGVNQPIEAPNDFNPQQADGGNYAGFGHVGSGPTGGPSTPGAIPGGNP